MASVGALGDLTRRRGRRCSRRPYWAISRRRWLAVPILVGSKEDGLVPPLAKEVGTAAVAAPGESAIRVAEARACAIVEIAEDDAAARRGGGDHRALAQITG